MGNCIQSERGNLSAETSTVEEVVRIMRPDGIMLEYKSPIYVRDLLMGYEGHTVVYSHGALRQPLEPDHQLVPGALYYLLPSQITANGSSHDISSQGNSEDNCAVDLRTIPSDNSHEAEPIVVSAGGSSKPTTCSETPSTGSKIGGALRLKVVITKQQLEALLNKNCMNKMSLEDLVLQLQAKARPLSAEHTDSSAGTKNCGWRPTLESIDEGSDVVLL